MHLAYIHTIYTCSTLCAPRLRDRVTIKTAGRHIVRETEDGTFEMKITSAVRSDMGVYTCKIINEYGSKQCECKLEVKGEGSFTVPLPMFQGILNCLCY